MSPDYCLVKELGTLKQIPSLGHLEEGLELVVVAALRQNRLHEASNDPALRVHQQLGMGANQRKSKLRLLQLECLF